MDLSLLIWLFPGILAFGVRQALCGHKQLPIADVIVSLALHSAFSLAVYSVISVCAPSMIPALGTLASWYFEAVRSQDSRFVEHVLLYHQLFFDRVVLTILVSSLLVGLASAVASDRNIIRKLGSKWHVFQSTQKDSVWIDALNSTNNYWVDVTLKDGRRIGGVVAHASWEFKDDGLFLFGVHQFSINSGQFKPLCPYIYFQTSDIAGPVIFQKQGIGDLE